MDVVEPKWRVKTAGFKVTSVPVNLADGGPAYALRVCYRRHAEDISPVSVTSYGKSWLGYYGKSWPTRETAEQPENKEAFLRWVETGAHPGLGQGRKVCGADGMPLHVNTRVQTQWTREEGGDDRWHAGTVNAILESGKVTIKYDDGDNWTGSAMEVHLLDSAHPLKAGPLLRGNCTYRLLGCLWEYNLLTPLVLMFVGFPYLLAACAGDTRTGEIPLWYTLDSCLSKTTPAFVYTLRAAAAAGARGGFQPQALPSPLPSSSLSP